MLIVNILDAQSEDQESFKNKRYDINNNKNFIIFKIFK
jgi:hypothetical protein